MPVAGLTSGPHSSEKPPARVLVVLDDPDSVDLVRLLLDCSDFRVHAAGGVAEALGSVRSQPPDLIVTEASSAGIDGAQLCRVLKLDPRTANIPVLLVSERGSDKELLEALGAGAADYISLQTPAGLMRKKCERLVAERQAREARHEAEAALKLAYAELEDRVDQRTAALRTANALLEAEAAERAKAERALRESEWRFRRIFEEAPIAIALVGLDRRFLKVNKSFCQLLGYTEQELSGMTFVDIMLPSDIERHLKIADEAYAGKRSTYSLEKRYVKKDGQVFWANLTATVVSDEEGRVLYKFGMIQDLSKDKILQQQLIESEKLSGLGRLVTGLAHELNNPLTSVIGFAELLLINPALAESLRPAIETINLEADRARRIVHNLLSFAMQHKAGRRPVDLNAIVDRCIEFRAYELNTNNISVKRQAADLPLVLADADQLQQVFLNIILNAEQAILSGNRGGELLITTIAEDRADGPWAVVTFADNGPGIPPELLDKVFDPFFTTKDVGSGTGLGLSISYGIIHEHRGRIRAESESGRGAVFIIELPAVGERD